MNIQILKDQVIIDGQVYVKQIEKIDIFESVKNNLIEKVKQFIAQKGNVNEKKGYDGTTPLYYAKTVEICQVLIEAGANVNEKDCNSYTPLHLVKDVEICQVLIEAGANINAKSGNGFTPLHFAKTVGICQVLIEAGANVNEKNRDGYTPLRYAEITNRFEVANYLKSLQPQTLMDAITANNLDFIRGSKEPVTIEHVKAVKDMSEIRDLLLSK